jgi:hypothetical protein
MISQENNDFLLNNKNLRMTLYLSLVVAHLIFGMLYPESITIAAVGFAFFAVLVMVHLRPVQQPPRIKIEKTVHLDK